MKDIINEVKKLRNLKALISLLTVGISLSALVDPALGLTFPLPSLNSDIIGEIQTTTVRRGESLSDIGRRHDVGLYEMIEANPNLDPWIPPPGSVVIIPTQFILPRVARVGIVLNLAEMRLYYYHPDKPLVTTHPLGIGRKGTSTPLGQTVITNKKKDPSWNPPDSIRQEHITKGDILPSVIPGGIPENPLGRYALYLSSKGLSKSGHFLIHGTNAPKGVGVRITHGCIRLYPEDIEQFFHLVPIGTTVRFIHEPYKVGWHNQHLYLEAHEPLSEPQYAGSDSISRLAKIIEAAIEGSHLINWTGAKMAAKAANGYPIRID